MRTRYWLELILLYGGFPLFILIFKERALMIGALWGCGLLALIWLVKTHQKGLICSFKEEWNWQGAKAGLKHILLRFAVIAPLIAAFTWYFHPDILFSFPRERTETWIIVMLLYPLLSVVPQEMIYKTLFFGRYKALFPDTTAMILASALAFGYMHIILVSPFAIVMTFLAGLLMSQTYAKTRSLALVSLEHTLYGCWAYTLGLGIYFYTGAAWGTH